MLDFIRNHKRLMQVFLALFILPGLGLVGIQGFRGFFDNSANVASVNGRKITIQEFDGAQREQLDRMRQMLGSSFDPKMFDTEAMRASLIDSLVQQRITTDETRRENLTVPDAAVQRALFNIPAIAQLRGPDGRVDTDAYVKLLAAQGMTPDQLDARVRFELANSQISESISKSAFTPKALATHLTALSEQTRTVQGLAFHPISYQQKAQPSDDELKQYYDAHKLEFQTPESAQIQYVVLNGDALAAATQPSDADAKQFYDDNIKNYKTDDQIRASHILITVAKDASEADRAKAKAKAEQILAQVRAHPDQFADLAKQNSQDPGSADKGGDLGWFGHGAMVKPFEDAAFALKPNQISDLVQSDFGYHIIKVTDAKPAGTKSFDEVKASILATLKAQQAQKLYSQDAEPFTNMVYEKADSLQPAADKFHLTIKTATVTRTPNPALQPTDPLNNPKFLTALFADDSLVKKHNTQAVDVGDNTLISARITQYAPVATPDFDKVKDAVRDKVVAQKTAELAKQDGAAKLAEFEKSKSADGFGTPVNVSRGDAQGLPPAAIDAIFKLDPNKTPGYVGVDLGKDGYAIYRLNAVNTPPAPDTQRLAAAEQQLSQVSGQADVQAYLASLRTRSDVKIYKLPAASDDSN
ncbi:SurA N-terminal domain-containing protein [Pararobbsia silviterrae]|uniref:Periplasmic chaperone PpiD n=1 Tax=Pararobbsia silviterrae TaxID=1792498 RepID=A0A494Y331_9BURK|nr:SurA N-terminal domain-containing protein [Pararobbsia silviterrae]RKP54742.1 peptidylprolyl isomerase [Pararobbsia silviterrae]